MNKVINIIVILFLFMAVNHKDSPKIVRKNKDILQGALLAYLVTILVNKNLLEGIDNDEDNEPGPEPEQCDDWEGKCEDGKELISGGTYQDDQEPEDVCCEVKNTTGKTCKDVKSDNECWSGEYNDSNDDETLDDPITIDFQKKCCSYTEGKTKDQCDPFKKFMDKWSSDNGTTSVSCQEDNIQIVNKPSSVVDLIGGSGSGVPSNEDYQKKCCVSKTGKCETWTDTGAKCDNDYEPGAEAEYAEGDPTGDCCSALPARYANPGLFGLNMLCLVCWIYGYMKKKGKDIKFTICCYAVPVLMIVINLLSYEYILGGLFWEYESFVAVFFLFVMIGIAYNKRPYERLSSARIKNKDLTAEVMRDVNEFSSMRDAAW